jgi:hypothetical protein
MIGMMKAINHLGFAFRLPRDMVETIVRELNSQYETFIANYAFPMLYSFKKSNATVQRNQIGNIELFYI